MAYLSVVNNLSMYYAPNPILADVTLDQWNRTFYDIDASSGNIVITLPPIPTPANLLQSGSLMFRRTDSSSNTVTLRYTFNGATFYTYNIEADVTYTHWIMSINDPTFYDQLQITRLSSQEFLKLSGGTMTGNLILNADPTNALGAATKQYVDAHVSPGGSFVLNGDVTSLPPISGVATSIVNSVGGALAADVANASTAVLAATNNATPNTLVMRSAGGSAAFVGLGATSVVAQNATFTNLSGSTLTGSLDSSNYNVLVKNPTNLAAGSKDAVNYGTLLTSLSSLAAPITQLQSDVTTPSGASGLVSATVASVGGKTAAQVATSVNDTLAATSANTNSTIVKRDSSGNFSANNVTAAIVSLGAAATLSSQAPTWGQVQNYVSLSRVNIKSVATVATTNQSVNATSYIGQTINGRTLAVGDRLALINNNTPVENGVYVVQAGGGILRSTDCAAGVDGNGFVFGVLYGTFANYFYRIALNGANTTAIFGTNVADYTVYFIIQNLVADGTSITLTGNTLSVTPSGIGTTQLAPYATGNRIMGTNSGTKKPEETSIASDKLAAAMVSTQGYVQVANFGSDTLGNGYLVPYATLSTALANTTGAGVIKCLGGYGATGAFTQSQDNQQIEGFAADGSQVCNITGSITAPSGRTRLKLKDIALTGNAANPIPYLCNSGNLGRNYFKNVSFIPYTTSPSLNITAAIQNWHEFDNCDFTTAVNIGGSVGTNEAYTFRNCRGAIYLYLTKNVPVTFIDCDAVFVMSHTAGQVLVYGRSTVNIASTATLVSGALIYLEDCTTWNAQTQSWGAISSLCTTQLNNVSRKAVNDSIAALTTLKTPVVPSTAAANYYVSGIADDGTLLTSVLPSAATKDVGVDTAVTITNANSPYPLTLSQTVVNVDASAGSVVINLPPIASVSTSLLNKRYTINRTDVMNGNAVLINCNSGTTDQFHRTPVGYSTYYLQGANSIQINAVTKSGGNVWFVESDSRPQYQAIPFDNMITSNLVMTYHGSLFTVSATSNIDITLPQASYGVGSTKIIRIDSNSQYTVRLLAPSGHTVNGAASVQLLTSGSATCRTISYGNSALVAELAQSSASTFTGAICLLSMAGTNVATITNSGAVIPFSSSAQGYTTYDPMGMHSGTTNPSRVNIQVAGVYEVSCYFRSIDWTSIGSTGCWLLKNGVAVTSNWQPVTPTYGSGSNTHVFNVTCAVGDYLEMFGQILGVTGSDGLTAASFSVKLGQGIPSNLPSLGSAGQVLTVNGSGSGLQYSTIANTSVTGSVLALRQSTGQNISSGAGAIALFDTADTELAVNPSNVGITVTGNNTFTNNTGSAMTITVSYQVSWTPNSSGQRYAWIQRNSTFNRVAMVTSVPFGGGDGGVQSSSATFSLASGEGFIIGIYQNSGATLTLNAGGIGMSAGYAGRVQITRII